MDSYFSTSPELALPNFGKSLDILDQYEFYDRLSTTILLDNGYIHNHITFPALKHND